MGAIQWWLKLFDEEADLTFIRHCVLAGYSICIFCLIVDFSVPNDFYHFQRSGSLACFFSVLAEFRIYQIKGRVTLRDSDFRWLKNLDLVRRNFSETNYCKGLKMFAHLSLGLGTIIWGYGDIPFR